MRSAKTAAVPLLLFAAILMLGCRMQTLPETATGSLAVSFGSESVGARTIAPAVTMEIAAYDVQGSGPEAAAFEATGLSGGSHQWDELRQGQWIVSVDARNADGIRIASATGTALVVGGETTNLALTVVPLTGPGTLAVSLSWPGSAIASPVVSASLTPEGGSPTPLELTVSVDSASWSSFEVEAGYYILTLRLLDQTALVWGRTEAVRILAGQTTSAVYPLTEADINGTPEGSVLLQVAAELKNPLGITLSGLQPLLPLQSVMTVTALADQAPDSWQWYLNGNPLSGATAGSVTVGGALLPGNYWLDVLARKGTVLSSAHGFFTVSTQLPVSTPSVGEIVINEIMIDPAGVADTSGEWFEVFNASGRPLDIEGLVVRTASQFVRIANSGAGLVAQPGEFLVLCRNGDPSLNGQVIADYTYGTGMTLANTGGSLTLAEFGLNGMDGAAIDTAQWTAAAAGKSFSLKSAFRNAVDNDVAANWYWSGTPYSATDMGTPGAANEQ